MKKKELAPRQIILGTLQLIWSDEDESYIARSPLADGVIGLGETREEAIEEFTQHLEVHAQAVEEGRHALYRKVGRPSEDRVSLNTRVKPEIKDRLKECAESLGCSAGEVIEYLFVAYEDITANDSFSKTKPVVKKLRRPHESKVQAQ